MIGLLLNIKLLRSLNVPVNVPVNVRQKLIIKLIIENKKITLDKIAEQCNVNRETIKRDLKKLRKINIIDRIGSDKSGYWEVVSD